MNISLRGLSVVIGFAVMIVAASGVFFTVKGDVRVLEERVSNQDDRLKENQDSVLRIEDRIEEVLRKR